MLCTTTNVPSSLHSLHKSYFFAFISVASSSRSSVKKRKALVKLKLAKIEAKQAEKRIKEESTCRLREIQRIQLEVEEAMQSAQRELQRKLGLPTAEYDV